MPARYILFDIQNAYTKIWAKRMVGYPIEVKCASVTDIVADVYVSPANGYGQLDGGIDKVYRTMFPGIQAEVNQALSTYKGRTPLIEGS
jgi:O-acetyl-ADP-ribose deacetylase (regulator of RNase III)